MLTESEFYDRLAIAYDVMNDWHTRLAAELPFIEGVLLKNNAVNVLDCACGTGRHAIALAERGYHVYGSDASPQMVNRARANSREQNVHVAFETAVFRDLSSTYKTRFDAVLCLGNSLPHVTTDEQARASLEAFHQCLRPNGILVMQNLNYDKRWKAKPRWFAANHGIVDGRDTLIWRFADYGESLITFNIAMFTHQPDGNWTVSVTSTPQRPYQKSELERLLMESRFHDAEFYGDLRGTAFDPDESADLVIVAHA